MLCGRVMDFIGHKASDWAADHLQTVLINDSVHTYRCGGKHVNLVQERDKIGKSAINTVYYKSI